MHATGGPLGAEADPAIEPAKELDAMAVEAVTAMAFAGDAQAGTP